MRASAELDLPTLPLSPGIVRVDMLGPGRFDYAVLLSEHDSMQAGEAEWAEEASVSPQLLNGATFAVRYLVLVDGQDSPLDLHAESSRAAVVQAIEERAERSGYWHLHPIDGRHVLLAATGVEG